MLLRKILSAFLVPPGLFILLIITALFLLWRKRRKVAAAVLWLVVLMILVLSSFIGEYILLRPLEEGYTPAADTELAEMQEEGKKTAVVVLAGDITRKNDGDKNETEIGEATLKRLIGGFKVYKETGFPICVSGGIEPGAQGDTLAGVMSKELTVFGVPENKIIEEGDSRTTWENAVYSIKLLKSQGFERVILITDAVHMKRSVVSFQDRGVEVMPYPSGYLYGIPGFTDWLPNSGSLNNNLRALHEWAGLVYYRIRY